MVITRDFRGAGEWRTGLAHLGRPNV